MSSTSYPRPGSPRSSAYRSPYPPSITYPSSPYTSVPYPYSYHPYAPVSIPSPPPHPYMRATEHYAPPSYLHPYYVHPHASYANYPPPQPIHSEYYPHVHYGYSSSPPPTISMRRSTASCSTLGISRICAGGSAARPAGRKKDQLPKGPARGRAARVRWTPFGGRSRAWWRSRRGKAGRGLDRAWASPRFRQVDGRVSSAVAAAASACSMTRTVSRAPQPGGPPCAPPSRRSGSLRRPPIAPPRS